MWLKEKEWGMMATTKKNPNEIAVAVRPYMGSDMLCTYTSSDAVYMGCGLCMWVVMGSATIWSVIKVVSWTS